MARRFVYVVSYTTKMEAYTTLEKATIELLKNGYKQQGKEWIKTNSKAEIWMLELK